MLEFDNNCLRISLLVVNLHPGSVSGVSLLKWKTSLPYEGVFKDSCLWLNPGSKVWLLTPRNIACFDGLLHYWPVC